jgi:hypothetical protein
MNTNLSSCSPTELTEYGAGALGPGLELEASNLPGRKASPAFSGKGDRMAHA